MIKTKLALSPKRQSLITCLVIIFFVCILWSSPWLLGSPIVVPILLALLPPLFYIGFYKPEVLSLAFFAFVVFRAHEIFAFLNPYKILFLLGLLGSISLIFNIFLKRIKIFWSSEINYFFAFFILATIGVPLSYSFDVSYGFWSEVLVKIIIIFFMITWTFRDEKQYKATIIISVLAGVYISSIVIYNKINGLHLIEGTRVTLGIMKGSLIGDPNDLALTLLFPFSFCCSLFFIKSNTLLIRLIGFVSFIMVAAGIFFTQSRGGLLGLAGVIGYFISRHTKSKILLVIIGSIAAVVIFYASGVAHRQTAGSSLGIDESGQGRLNAWKAALNMALHHPIFGVGLNGFNENFFQYAITWDNYNHAVHSSWMGVLAEMGFPGLFLFVTCVYLVLKSSKENMKKIEQMAPVSMPHKNTYLILARSTYAGVIGFCISSTFLTQAFSWPFYLYSALSIALTHHIDGLKYEKNKLI